MFLYRHPHPTTEFPSCVNNSMYVANFENICFCRLLVTGRHFAWFCLTHPVLSCDEACVWKHGTPFSLPQMQRMIFKLITHVSNDYESRAWRRTGFEWWASRRENRHWLNKARYKRRLLTLIMGAKSMQVYEYCIEIRHIGELLWGQRPHCPHGVPWPHCA